MWAAGGSYPALRYVIDRRQPDGSYTPQDVSQPLAAGADLRLTVQANTVGELAVYLEDARGSLVRLLPAGAAQWAQTPPGAPLSANFTVPTAGGPLTLRVVFVPTTASLASNPNYSDIGKLLAAPATPIREETHEPDGNGASRSVFYAALPQAGTGQVLVESRVLR